MAEDGYVELQVTSCFSFLRGAGQPFELAAAAAACGHGAIGVSDFASLAGAVRMHLGAREAGIRALIGARIDPGDGPPLLLYPMDRAAYGRLSRLITLGKRRTTKDACELWRRDIEAQAEGLLAIVLPPLAPDAAFDNHLAGWRHVFGDRLSLAACHRHDGQDAARLAALAGIAEAAGVPLVATNDVRYPTPARRRLADVMTCIREGCTIDAAGWRLDANAERYPKPAAEMRRLFAGHEEAVARTVEIASRIDFQLDELRYEYPEEVAEGEDPQTRLATLTAEGAAQRWPGGVPGKVKAQITHELRLIEELRYAPYFLTVHDIVRFARSRDILCQGRGSAANSAVCYALGITAVDPANSDLLFERFISAARNEPPDIDVDFEHERREEVIQYIYDKYGRHRAALAATLVCFRARGAIREVGKVFGLSPASCARLAASLWGWGAEAVDEARAREQGLDPTDPRLGLVLEMAREIIGFPRHLSQHVGGFVIARDRVDELCPVLNAAMADRTTLEWDKEDLEALGVLKVDCLALGMLTCIRKCFDLVAKHYGKRYTLASVPPDDKATYDMLCRADSLGVFQVESRAQMTMLPRLKPRCFHDLVIEVAIVRPGPIQGDMVHPYLRRRNGEEPVSYPSRALEQVLGKTLGVPLFQEQAMKIAIVAAGFTPEQADRLRRAMATFKNRGELSVFHEQMVGGMIARGYDEAFAKRCFKQIEGFGTYGFPESHAASFALLVYVSSWLKCHYPDAFACALLNSQPMGFYAPAQIVRDAREHGVTVRPPCVNASNWDNTLEPDFSLESRHRSRLTDTAERKYHALRLGLRQIRGMPEAEARALVAARGNGYRTPEDLKRKAGLTRRGLDRLVEGDAFAGLGLDRRAAGWRIAALTDAPPDLLEEAEITEPAVRLPELSAGEQVVQDYGALRLSLKAHPLALLRGTLKKRGYRPAGDVARLADGTRLNLAGLVLVRQRPGSARGVVFITLEDETGIANLVVMPDRFERFRKQILTSRLLGVRGVVEREGAVIHLRVRELRDESALLARLSETGARPAPPRHRHPREAAPLLAFPPAAHKTHPQDGEVFARAIAPTDEVKNPAPDPREIKAMRQRFPDGRNFR